MIEKSENSAFKKEYGILCRRIYPKAAAETPFGATWCKVEAGGATDPHSHHEGETFFIIDGRGQMTIGEETNEVGNGDVVYIPKHQNHVLKNLSSEEPLTFLSVWWEAV